MRQDCTRRTTLSLTRLDDRINPAPMTYTVTNAAWNPALAGTLPHAINLANANPGQDEIVFDFSAAGLNTNTPVFNSTGKRLVTEGVIIRGGGGAQFVTITGETPFEFTHTGAVVTDARTGESELRNMVFHQCQPAAVNINGEWGGAIRVLGGQVTTVNTRFTNNFAINGGAAYVDEDATLVLDGDQSAPPNTDNYPEQLPTNGKSRTLFQDNTTNGGVDGGAIENDGAVILKRVMFFRNTAGNRGGAINNNSDDATLYVPVAPLDANGVPQQSGFTDVTFKLNSAQQGGAVMFKGSNTSNLIGVKVMYNTAVMDGGGFCVLDGTVNVQYSTMQGNTALRGSAVYLLGAVGDAPTVDLKKVTFGGNNVTGAGSADIDVSTRGLLTTHGCFLNGDTILATIAAGQALAGTFNPDPNDPNTP